MAKKLRKQDICLNCNTEIGSANYCPECGQINSHKHVPLKHFLQDIVGDFLTFDSRFFKSFAPLISKPGHLTNEYNLGKRNRYIFPLRLYVFATILFFFVIAIQSKINSKSLEQLKQESTPITIDSIKHVISKIDSNIDNHALNTISIELKSNFAISAKAIDIDDKIVDSLTNMIGRIDRSLSTDQRIEVARRTKQFFRLSKKKKNRSVDLDSLKQLLTNFTFLSTGSQVGFQHELDSLFRIRIRNINVQNSFNLVTDRDSLEDGLMKDFVDYIDLKGKYINSRGDDGFALILSEFMNQIPKVMFLILPIFALILKLLYIRKKILYINHLIFTLHLHTVIFLYLLIAILIPHWSATLAAVLGIWLYMFFAFKNVYKQSIIMTFIKLNTLLIAYFFPLLGGFVLMGLLALISV